MAMAPLPVPTSRIDGEAMRLESTIHRTSSSVLRRGINTPSRTCRLRPQKLRMPQNVLEWAPPRRALRRCGRAPRLQARGQAPTQGRRRDLSQLRNDDAGDLPCLPLPVEGGEPRCELLNDLSTCCHGRQRMRSASRRSKKSGKLLATHSAPLDGDGPLGNQGGDRKGHGDAVVAVAVDSSATDLSAAHLHCILFVEIDLDTELLELLLERLGPVCSPGSPDARCPG